MTKWEGRIADAIREHAESRAREIGLPKISLGRWLAVTLSVATAITIASASGVVISGSLDGPAREGQGSLLGQQLAQGMPMTPTPSNGLLRSHAFETHEAEPNVPYLTAEFVEVAVDALRHNVGIPLKEAKATIDLLVALGQHCVRHAQERRCILTADGVRLDFRKGEHLVVYERHSKDGTVDLGNRRVGAVQKGDTVEVIADPRHREFPIPVQRP